MSLRQTLSTPGGKAAYTRQLFARIADRYDLITVLLSGGLDRRWKARLVGLAPPLEGRKILDLATGTGDLAFSCARRGGHVTGLDITPRMVQLALARRRDGDLPGPSFLVGDMMALPFPDAAFDLVTTGYGLRNVPQLKPALREIRRVLRPGGRMLSLDFNLPESTLVRTAYLGWLTVIGSILGTILHRDPDTYRYIPETLRRYPAAGGIVSLFEAEGFERVRWYRVLGGLMAIHEARVPA